MSLTRQSDVRQLPVRLCDVRAEVRFDAAAHIAYQEPGVRGGGSACRSVPVEHCLLGSRFGLADPCAGRSVKQPSQADLIARVLADGRPHTAAEIHHQVGFCRLNSRVAELRSRRGMNIVCAHLPEHGRGPDAYEYRLVAPLKEPCVVADRGLGGLLHLSDTHGSLSGVGLVESDDPHNPPGTAQQLSVYDALGEAA